MRQEFSADVPHWQQLLSTSAMRTPGRKHQKRKGVKASQRAANNKTKSFALRNVREAERKQKVRDYWTGLRDTNPEAA